MSFTFETGNQLQRMFRCVTHKMTSRIAIFWMQFDCVSHFVEKDTKCFETITSLPDYKKHT